jgi:hypothetical protein
VREASGDNRYKIMFLFNLKYEISLLDVRRSRSYRNLTYSEFF